MPAMNTTRYSSKPDLMLAKAIKKHPNGKSRSEKAMTKTEEESKSDGATKVAKPAEEDDPENLTEDEVIDVAEKVFVRIAE